MEIYHPNDDELLREMRRVRRSAKKKRLIWGLVIWLALSVAAGLFVFTRYYRIAVMQGPAMGDTLPAGTLVLVRKPDNNTAYVSGDIILYEKQMAAPVELTILSPKGKIRDYCRYKVYRDLGTTRQYMRRKEGQVTWVEDISAADEFESNEEGIVRLDTTGMPNGEYYLKETHASYGQNVLEEPIPFAVSNPTMLQIKRVLGAGGDNIVLSPYTEIIVNGREIGHTRTWGRTADARVDNRRVVVRPGEYFVQGDQLSLSVDSRDPDYDLVYQAEVLGMAEFALWPIRAFGTLTGQSVTADAAGQEGAE